MQTNLFPETLLVDIADGHTFTTSLKIAEHFHKPHGDLMKKIHAIVKRTPSDRSQGNFSLSTYKNPRGKIYPMYLLTREAFEFIATGFTSAKAEEWKWKFFDAFRAMEAKLAAHIQREANALHTLRPFLRPVVEGTLAGQSRGAIGEPLGKSPSSMGYHRAVARRLGLLPPRPVTH